MTATLAEDTVHTLLADSERRHLLSLLSRNGKANIDDLARLIAAREGDKPPGAVSAETQQRITISLVHNHLPRLAEHDVVSYDQEEVVLMDVFDELEPYLRGPSANFAVQELSD